MQVDASDVGMGAVLSQTDEEGMGHPTAYFSRKLLPREHSQGEKMFSHQAGGRDILMEENLSSRCIIQLYSGFQRVEI